MLASKDSFSTGNIKSHLGSHRFKTVDYTGTAEKLWLKEQDTDFYK
jgi:hypothetical protein